MTAAPHINADDPIGRRYGTRTVIAVVSRSTSGTPRLVRTICDGGHVSEHRLAYLAHDPNAATCGQCERASIGARAAAMTAETRRRASATRWSAMVGQRIGERTIVAYEGLDDRYQHLLRVRCDCTNESIVRASSLKLSSGCKRCRSGRKPGTSPRPVLDSARVQRHEALLARCAAECPEVWRLECTCGAGERCHRCEVQIEAWAELSALIDGATLEEIGALMGLSRERIRQVEAVALRRLDTPVTRELAAERIDRDDDWMTRGAEA